MNIEERKNYVCEMMANVEGGVVCKAVEFLATCSVDNQKDVLMTFSFKQLELLFYKAEQLDKREVLEQVTKRICELDPSQCNDEMREDKLWAMFFQLDFNLHYELVMMLHKKITTFRSS